MSNSLGNTLKVARSLTSLTLRQVEDATGISNAYLSQLENDKIKKPSADVLYKLASVYRVDFDSLMRGDGVIDEPENRQRRNQDDFSSKVALYAKDLSAEEKEEILDFLKFKVQRQKKS